MTRPDTDIDGSAADAGPAAWPVGLAAAPRDSSADAASGTRVDMIHHDRSEDAGAVDDSAGEAASARSEKGAANPPHGLGGRTTDQQPNTLPFAEADPSGSSIHSDASHTSGGRFASTEFDAVAVDDAPSQGPSPSVISDPDSDSREWAPVEAGADETDVSELSLADDRGPGADPVDPPEESRGSSAEMEAELGADADPGAHPREPEPAECAGDEAGTPEDSPPESWPPGSGSGDSPARKSVPLAELKARLANADVRSLAAEQPVQELPSLMQRARSDVDGATQEAKRPRDLLQQAGCEPGGREWAPRQSEGLTARLAQMEETLRASRDAERRLGAALAESEHERERLNEVIERLKEQNRSLLGNLAGPRQAASGVRTLAQVQAAYRRIVAALRGLVRPAVAANDGTKAPAHQVLLQLAAEALLPPGDPAAVLHLLAARASTQAGIELTSDQNDGWLALARDIAAWLSDAAHLEAPVRLWWPSPGTELGADHCRVPSGSDVEDRIVVERVILPGLQSVPRSGPPEPIEPPLVVPRSTSNASTAGA